MQKQVALAAIGGLTLLGIVAVGAFNGDWSDRDRSKGALRTIVENESNWITTTPEELRKFPRGPQPRTYPGSWVVSEDYPRIALDNEMAGVTVVRLTVDVYGEVSACEVSDPSPFAALDRRVCDTISTRARYYPAMDAEQNPVVAEVSQAVRWVLPAIE